MNAKVTYKLCASLVTSTGMFRRPTNVILRTFYTYNSKYASKTHHVVDIKLTFN